MQRVFDLSVEAGKLKTGKAIAAGEFVMMLPPNNICTADEIPEGLLSIQVRPHWRLCLLRAAQCELCLVFGIRLHALALSWFLCISQWNCATIQ